MSSMTPLAPTPLVIAGVPSNIRLPPGSRATHVDSDMHSISSRLREIDPNLFVALIEHADGEQAVWAVCETDRTGVESLVFRVGPGCQIDALDQRVITHIEWIRRIPADQRAREIQKQLDIEEVARADTERDTMYEKMGGSLYDNLFKCGFVMTPKPESYRPLNRTARRAGRKIR